MLVIRMQRTGRKGHAQFRVVVQDSRRTPTSGRIVAALGHYNPHTKEAAIDKEKVAFYLEHGAQPSDRVARLLRTEGVKLPEWVKLPTTKEGSLRNPDKLRKNRPAEEAAPEAPETADADEAAADVAEEPTEVVSEVPAEVAEEEVVTPEEAPAEAEESAKEAESSEEETKEAEKPAA